jgi:outer membrane protein assembly factor BamB
MAVPTLPRSTACSIASALPGKRRIVMRRQRLIFALVASAAAGTVTVAQPGRGGSQWLTALGDAQRTSWVRTDSKISVASLAKPGFDLQWKVKLDNRPRGVRGLTQGVTASGVTLFVPMSVVAGSSNNIYALDNDTGYVVWRRQFDVVPPAPTAACPGGITSAATRLVRLDASATAAAPGLNFGAGSAGYRSLLGEPGEGVPVEGRAGGPGRSGDPSGVPPPAGARGANPAAAPGTAARGAGAAGPPPAPPARAGQPPQRIPGTPKREENASPFASLFRESGVGYVVSSDGMLHVLGLPSGKDMQRPAPFLPANANWSAPIAVDTTLYAATSGNCGGAPNAVWAIDLDSEAKPVVSWKTNGGSVVGAIAFTPDGTLIAAIGPGQAGGDAKSNAIVALDAKTLQLKDWFAQPTAEFVTGPTILHHNGKDIVAAATKDGRVLLLDSASLGGADHATPLFASKRLLGSGATFGGDALAAWQQSDGGTSWILVPIKGPLAAGYSSANGGVSAGAVAALKVVESGGALSLEPGWVSHDLTSPATPIIVNGVVFALATGVPSTAGGRGAPAVLHAYDGATGKRLWNSAKSMTMSASPGSMWSGLGQVYVGMQDGTLHAFGFNDERRATSVSQEGK